MRLARQGKARLAFVSTSDTWLQERGFHCLCMPARFIVDPRRRRSSPVFRCDDARSDPVSPQARSSRGPRACPLGTTTRSSPSSNCRRHNRIFSARQAPIGTLLPAPCGRRGRAAAVLACCAPRRALIRACEFVIKHHDGSSQSPDPRTPGLALALAARAGFHR